jgi:NADH:ubiquinone reductase (H+-translocating)
MASSNESPSRNGRPPHVLVLGGGYAAIGAVRALRRTLRDRRVNVTVVDRENFHFYHGLVAEFVTGRIAPTNALSPARRIFPPAKFHEADVESVDLEGRKVVTTRELDGLRHETSYDHLVLALGVVDNLEMYPGLAEHAFRLKTYDDCFHLKNHILSMFEMAEIEPDPEERRALLTFFIAGGGYAGTELAGELADLIRRLTEKEFRNIRREECRVVLVQPGPTILPELYGSVGDAGHAEGHPKLVEWATRFITQLGVEVMTDTAVSAASPNDVVLSNGTQVPTRTIISAVGTRQLPLMDRLDVPKDPRGRAMTDRYMRVQGLSDVWAAGDCAAVPFPDGGFCPPRALEAMQHGKRAGKNILLALEGRPPELYRYRALGQVVPLGRHRAVGEMKGLELTGQLPWLMLKAFQVYYTPTWDRRLRIVSDWFITGMVGRDIVESSVADLESYDLHDNLFQPGEVIVREGRTGRHAHVILEGEVELVRDKDGSEDVLATLGPGDSFGQVWRDRSAPESARAKTVVRTVAMRVDQTRRIRKLVTSFGKVASGAVAVKPKAAPRPRPRSRAKRT